MRKGTRRWVVGVCVCVCTLEGCGVHNKLILSTERITSSSAFGEDASACMQEQTTIWLAADVARAKVQSVYSNVAVDTCVNDSGWKRGHERRWAVHERSSGFGVCGIGIVRDTHR